MKCLTRGRLIAAGMAGLAALMSAPVGAATSSPGCTFVNSYSFPVVWSDALGGSFSPSQQFYAGETISVQATWTGGPAATSAKFHVNASGLNISQNVSASGSISSSYTLPANSSYIDVGLEFLPSNVGRGSFSLTLTCQAQSAKDRTTNTDSARMAALVRNIAPVIANISAQATSDMVLGNIDAVLGGGDTPQANDRGFRVSSFGALAFAEQRAAARGATRALDAVVGGDTRGLRLDPPQWNVWMAGRYTGASGAWPNLGSARGENIVGGIDRRIGRIALFGLFAGYEDFKFWNGFDARIRGYGPSVGPYAGLRLSENLTFDALAVYTSVRYEAAAGLAAGALHADRFMFAAALTARIRIDDVRFDPQAKLQYLTERQASYTDTLGTYQHGSGFSAGRMSIGTKAAYLGLRAKSLPFTPWAGAYGDLTFGQQARAWTPAISNLGNGFSLRTTAGVDADFGPATLSMSGEYGGIGAAYRTASGRASIRIGF